MQKLIKFISGSIIIFILGIFYFSLNKNTNYNTETLIGNQLENFNLTSFENDKNFTIEDFKNNRYTLINFWASWCAPCRREHPNLMKLSKEQNLKILGVNFKDKKDNALEFLKDLGNPYDYLANDNFGKQSIHFGIYGIPESILVDNEFKIIKKIVGPINLEDLKSIKEIVNSL